WVCLEVEIVNVLLHVEVCFRVSQLGEEPGRHLLVPLGIHRIVERPDVIGLATVVQVPCNLSGFHVGERCCEESEDRCVSMVWIVCEVARTLPVYPNPVQQVDVSCLSVHHRVRIW